MNAIDTLKKEHRATETLLAILEKVSERMETGQAVHPGDLNRILEFIRTFTDRCHHGKEEEILFPALLAAGLPKEGGPIGLMLMEHEAGRQFVAAMEEAMTRHVSGKADAGPEWAKQARGYIAHLRQHIEKEDRVLFPMAEGRLSPEKLAELAEAFERMEETVIGPGRHEELHRLLEDLRRSYLD